MDKLHLLEKAINNEVVDVQTFRNNLKNPLIHNHDGNSGQVTFVYFGDETTGNIVFHSSATGFGYEKNQFENIEGTIIWYKTYEFDYDLEFIYWFSINDSLDNDGLKRQQNITFDPLNEKRFVMKDDPEVPFGSDFVTTHCQLPQFIQKKWAVEHEHDIKIEKHYIKSDHLNNERRVWYYQPEGVQTQDAHVLLVVDGNYYVNQFYAVHALEQLHLQNKIQPTVAIFVSSNKERMAEFSFNDDYSQFINEEVRASMIEKYGLSSDPNKWILCGHSLGGLEVAYLAVKHPDKYEHVILQSAALYWKKDDEEDHIHHLYKTSEQLKTNFYITYGVLESGPNPVTSIAHCNQRFIETVREKNLTAQLNLFKSGHDYLSWGETMAEGLLHLVGKTT